MSVPVPHLTAPKPFESIRRFVRRVREMAAPTLIQFKVHIAYDDEASVWYVAESDIPGLSLEAENPQRLIERIEQCACDLIELNADEIAARFAPRKRKAAIAVLPVFDSPLQLAGACA
jgi:hypothetical protein